MTETTQTARAGARALTAVRFLAILSAGCGTLEPTASLSPEHGPFLSVEGSGIAEPGRVVISQVYGGGGNTGAPFRNDFVELYNAGGTSVSLGGLSVQYASATGTGHFAANSVTPLSGSLAPGQYYLVRQGGGTTGALLPTPDAIGTVNMSAMAGKVVVVRTTTGLACNGGSTPCTPAQLAQIVDLVGYGNANFFEGSAAAPTPSNTTAALRKNSGAQDTDNNANDFVAGAPTPRNTSSSAPAVATTVPASGATDVAVDANVVVTFNKPVNVVDGWFTIACGTNGARSAKDATTDGVTFTLDPDANFAGGETCTTTVVASKVTDRSDPSTAMRADYAWSFTTVASNPCELPFTPVYTVQGRDAALPALFANQTVTTQGVVVGDYEGPSPELRGFYIQDRTGDAEPATSDGIFVFNGNDDDVKLGDVVRVTGRAEEFQGQSQIGNVTSVRVCGSGASVTPVDVTLPFASADFAERYEGMLVRLPQTLYVTEHFQLGRFGQVVVSSANRLFQPTSVVAPGGPAAALQQANALNRLIIDDARQTQNADPIIFGREGSPLSASNTLRGGDAATGIVGVMTYTWAGNAASGNAYRVRPLNALSGAVRFEATNARPATPPAVGGTLKVAAMNVLNYFNTVSGCTNGVGGAPTGCRGADNAMELERQSQKTVVAIVALDADVLGIIELENDGYGPGSALADLVARVNAATAPGTYAFIDADGATGRQNALGTDAIKVALIYKPAKVTPTGVTAVLNSAAFVNGGDGVPRNRPALAQAFVQRSNRGRFVVAVNHLKSKSGACDEPDAGDGQGDCNGVRTVAARELAGWMATDPTDTGELDVLIVGDLNAHAKENPITALATAGYTDLIAARVGQHAYSYVFDGQWGYLDHALGSATIAPQVAGVGEWHINADEPSVLDYNTEFKSAGQIESLYRPDQFRVADHDPVVVGLNPQPPPVTYAFGGFLSPVANAPAFNQVNAGRAVPVKFSLGGNRGLNIFVSGYPAARRISCTSGSVQGITEEIDTSGNSAMSYNASSDTYTYVWKTDKARADSCWELVLRLNDETQHTARFQFTR